MTTQLALQGPAFKTVDKLYSDAILEKVDAAVKVAKDLVGKEEEEVKQLEELREKIENDRKALVAKIREFDRRFGGYYGTGF